MNACNVQPAQTADAEPLLILDDISRCVPGPSRRPMPILDRISLVLRTGEVVAVMGPSGAGKTALLRSVTLLPRPDRGKILYRGRDWMKRPSGFWRLRERAAYAKALRQFRAETAMVFQHFNLFPHLTVLRNVSLPLRRVLGMSRSAAEASARAAIARVELSHRTQSYPHQLSGGERQRVAIARALVMRPRLLLVDEPTSALDRELRETIHAQLRQLTAEGMTMIVVTHDNELAEAVADRIVYLEAGRIVGERPCRGSIPSSRSAAARPMVAAELAAPGALR